MIIYKCDICKKEFKPTRLMNGEIAYSVFNHFYKSTTLVQGQMTPQDKVDPYMLCSDCGKALSEKVGELIKQNEKPNEKVEDKTGEQTPKKDK